MKRLMWLSVLAVLVTGLTVSCTSLRCKKAGECEKKTEKRAAKAERVEKKAEEAKVEKAEAKAEVAAGLQKVKSSTIEAVGYDAATKDLTIVFVKTGETYVYHNVPENVYKKLMAADSKGKFFTKNIKDKYEFTKK